MIHTDGKQTIANAEHPLYLVRAECGDYYCGCGGGHVCAVATSRADAETLLKEAEKTTHTYVEGGKEYKTWPWGHTIEEVSINKIIKERRG